MTRKFGGNGLRTRPNHQNQAVGWLRKEILFHGGSGINFWMHWIVRQLDQRIQISYRTMCSQRCSDTGAAHIDLAVNFTSIPRARYTNPKEPAWRRNWTDLDRPNIRVTSNLFRTAWQQYLGFYSAAIPEAQCRTRIGHTLVRVRIDRQNAFAIWGYVVRMRDANGESVNGFRRRQKPPPRSLLQD